ncbi:MAG TPA: MFS transporter [Streptosporangiaceae bacterium]|nr:MFS transporter [Streptosporangiaceae bacterium]
MPVNRQSRWAALVVLCTGMLMIVLDATVVNVALPSIQHDLGFSQSSLAWVVNAYLISFGGLLLLSGRLGDLVGRRRIFLAGICLFTAASLACGVAQSEWMLIGARFVQGVGGAMTSAVILGMIVTMFPEPAEQARAVGLYAFVASAGGAVGLLAGGVLTDTIGWHWIFIVNVPIGIATGLLASRMIRQDDGSGLRGGADFPGAVLVTGAMMLAVFTIVEPAAQQGWLAGRTLACGGASLALLAAFAIRQVAVRYPLVPPRVLASRTVLGANLVQMLSVAGMFGVFFLGALYLRQVLGYSPLQTGLAFLPVTVLMGTLSVRYSARLVMRIGARGTLVAGLVAIAAGLALFARVPVHGTYLADIFPVTVLIGTGAGLAFPALMTLAMSGAAPADAGLASGLINTTAQVGGAIGLAVLATVSASTSGALLAHGTSAPAALTGGYHVAFRIAAALVATAVGVAVTVLRPEPAAVQQPVGAQGAEELPVGEQAAGVERTEGASTQPATA